MNLYRTFTEYKERCLVDGFPSRISSLLAPLLSIVYINDLPNCARFVFFFFSCFFFRDNEIISRRRDEKRSLLSSLHLFLSRYWVMTVTSACYTVCETARGHSTNRIKWGYRCKQARDFTNDTRVSWDESNCALSLCRLRWVWNFVRVLTIKHIPETGPRHNTGSFHKLFWGGCMH